MEEENGCRTREDRTGCRLRAVEKPMEDETRRGLWTDKIGFKPR
jgi:hypothetical protein